ncbi:MAG: OmpA family protein [Candidatus Dependentiae bacterium]|nr:OmpA family protein [Candidatus Dependentiae bacterium]
MHIKKQYLPILILLVGLSGCGKKKKNSAKNNPKKTSKTVALHIPVAQDTITIADDESIRNFFDQDIEEFVSLAKEETSRSADAHLKSGLPCAPSTAVALNDAKDFAWMNNTTDKDQEFQTIYFDFDSQSIRKDQEKVANNDVANAQTILAEARKNGTEPTIIIEGHADHAAGSAIYNLALSEARAKATADWFVSQNVPKENIKIVGRGFEVPAIVSGKAVEGDKNQQWPNRRAEIHVLYS